MIGCRLVITILIFLHGAVAEAPRGVEQCLQEQSKLKKTENANVITNDLQKDGKKLRRPLLQQPDYGVDVGDGFLCAEHFLSEPLAA